MKRILAYTYLSIIACLLLLQGCTLDIPPADQYADPDAIADVQNARSLLASAYQAYPHIEYELSTIGPDFCPTNLVGKDVAQKNLYAWQDNSLTLLANDAWAGYYNCIAQCDALLDRLSGVAVSTAAKESELACITAEAKTLKALCLFQLLQLFAPRYADDPQADGIILTDHLGLKYNQRSSITDCTTAIRTLLTEAEAVANTPKSNGWFSQTAVRCLLAQLELYAGRYAEAERWASQVWSQANNAMFTVAGFSRLFLPATCNERIFAFFTDMTFYVSIQFSASEGDYFALNPAATFAATDVRHDVYADTLTMDGQRRTLVGKYNRMNRRGSTTQYINTLRYTHALFTLAEAQARRGNSSKAINTLNTWLTTIGATPLPTTLTGEALIDAILAEKLREFAGEGIALFDLKRNGRSLPRLGKWGSATTSTIAATDYRWTLPIPRSEYRYNDNVKQNQGW